jgi:hypothetical protein
LGQLQRPLPDHAIDVTEDRARTSKVGDQKA